ncbi:MAG: DUF2934 domain-containing protein [Magnetospirillum gryphiswaldense]|nr:DUF2934 domain-containing protein [Magnetospirillum gryphiswaldense]
MSVTQDQIQELAYRLWQEDGSPAGRDMDYWLRAEAALHTTVKPKAEKKAVAKPKIAKPAAKAKASAAKPKAATTKVK